MLKYIVIPRSGFEAMITFPEFMEHDDMAINIGFSKDDVISAGFIDDKLKCHHYSHSLGIDSRPEKDTALLKFNLGIKE